MRHCKSAIAFLLIFSAQSLVTSAFANDAVDADNTKTSDADADTSIRAMSEIVVTAQRTTIDLARAAQKEAENIVNVVAHDEIFKLPIVNAGDAVRTIPGVQLETDTGEGRFVNIRGLDSDLSSTTFGGVRLPATDVTTSPYGGGRAVSFDAIPAEMIGAVTVTKTNRPEQEAEALGGTIEISPKTVPLSGKPYFGDVRLGNGLEPLRHTHIQDYAATVGGRFGAKGSDYTPFSAIGVFSYYKDARGVDDLEEGYVDNQSGGIPDKAQTYWEQRYYKQHKKRHVYGAELGYAPSSDHKWFIRYYDFGVVQDYNRNAVIYPFNGAPTVNADGSFTDTTGVGSPPSYAQKYYRSTTETFDTRLAQIGGNNDLDWLKLDYWVAHTQGLYNKPFDYKPIWQLSAPTTFTYNNSNSVFPSIAYTGGANPNDYNSYTLSAFSNSTQKSVTRDWQGKLNAAIPTHWTGYPTEELKFGLGARLREYDQNTTTYNATSVPALPLVPAFTGGGVGYYDGHYNMGPLIGTGYFNNAFANGAGAGFANNPQSDLAQGALASYNVKEDVYAGYGQYQFGFGKLGLFTGVRVEHTKEVFGAFTVNQLTNAIAPISSGHSYTDVLPSLQTRYEFTPSIIGRAIYSSTIGRPGYNQLSPALNINIPANLVSLGNPNLNPTHSHNIDLSIEDYLPHAGILSAGVFYKDLKDYIVPLRTNQTFPNTGIFAGLTPGLPIPVLTFENGSAARVLGVEANAERRFDELPGFWSGFGASANWTGVNSRIQIRPGNYTALPSTARNTANAALFYEQAGLNVRLGVNYISRSIFAIGASPALDTYSESRTSVDFGSSYFILENVKLYVDGKNLTNTPLKYTEGLSTRPIQRETYGQTWQFGVEATF
ncbi:MAG TPA: TonB-dependent receptor [Steroidobacteraceae bacterium]